MFSVFTSKKKKFPLDFRKEKQTNKKNTLDIAPDTF